MLKSMNGQNVSVFGEFGGFWGRLFSPCSLRINFGKFSRAKSFSAFSAELIELLHAIIHQGKENFSFGTFCAWGVPSPIHYNGDWKTFEFMELFGLSS